MEAQENKQSVRNYLEALPGKPKPPEFVDQYVAEHHISIDEVAFPGYELDFRKSQP